jgi:AbrB family looped-hinge helix DNA binding protein
MTQMPDDDLIVKVSKVLEKGLVQIPLEIRQKLDLKPGTKMIVYATEDGVVLRKAELFFEREAPIGLLRKIRGIFSKVPIRNIEE